MLCCFLALAPSSSNAENSIDRPTSHSWIEAGCPGVYYRHLLRQLFECSGAAIACRGINFLAGFALPTVSTSAFHFGQYSAFVVADVGRKVPLLPRSDPLAISAGGS